MKEKYMYNVNKKLNKKTDFDLLLLRSSAEMLWICGGEGQLWKTPRHPHLAVNSITTSKKHTLTHLYSEFLLRYQLI